MLEGISSTSKFALIHSKCCVSTRPCPALVPIVFQQECVERLANHMVRQLVSGLAKFSCLSAPKKKKLRLHARRCVVLSSSSQDGKRFTCPASLASRHSRKQNTKNGKTWA